MRERVFYPVLSWRPGNLGFVVFMLVVIFIRLTIMCVVLTARLAYWTLKALTMMVTALAAAISTANTPRPQKTA